MFFRRRTKPNAFFGIGTKLKTANNAKWYTRDATDDFFKAIVEGKSESVARCLSDRLINWQARDEAGLDLASRCNHTAITAMLKKHLDTEAAMEEEKTKKSYQKAGIYDRAELNFDHKYYFNKILFETNLNKTAALYVCYKTQLEFPFLKDALVKLDSIEGQNNLLFTYDLNKQNQAQIFAQLQSVLMALIRFKKKDGSEIATDAFDRIYAGLEAFFIDAAQGFPGENYLLRNKLFQREKKSLQTFTEFELYRAASQFNSKKMYELLRSPSADPNSRFDSETILHIAACLGSSNAFVTSDVSAMARNAAQVLETIEYLLVKGADPALETHGETVMEFLIHYFQFINKEEHKELYKKIIARLTANLPYSNLKPHVTVHPSVAGSSLSKIVIAVNDEMKNISQRKPYIRDVITTPGVYAEFTLNMTDGSKINVKSKEVANLTKEEYEELYQFFDPRCPLCPTSNINKKQYFDTLISARAETGVSFVETIRQNGVLKGIIVYEMISTQRDHKNENIYHVKLTLANVNQYLYLMKLLTYLRGFAFYHNHPDDINYIYCEPVSARGFATADIFRRFPESLELKNVMRDLIATVYSNKVVLEHVNNCYYVKDALDIEIEDVSATDKINFSSIERKIYKNIYHRRGYALCVASLSDEENYQRLTKLLLPLIGSSPYLKLQSFYSQQLNMFKARMTYESNDVTKCKSSMLKAGL